MIVKATNRKAAASRENGKLYGGRKRSLWVVVGQDGECRAKVGKSGHDSPVSIIHHSGTISATVGGVTYAADAGDYPAPGVYVLPPAAPPSLGGIRNRGHRVTLAPVVGSVAPPSRRSSFLPGASTPLQDPVGVTPVGPWGRGCRHADREDEILRLLGEQGRFSELESFSHQMDNYLEGGSR
jgi:hypothetical protein